MRRPSRRDVLKYGAAATGLGALVSRADAQIRLPIRQTASSGGGGGSTSVIASSDITFMGELPGHAATRSRGHGHPR
jgi:hypothetical protein